MTTLNESINGKFFFNEYNLWEITKLTDDYVTCRSCDIDNRKSLRVTLETISEGRLSLSFDKYRISYSFFDFIPSFRHDMRIQRSKFKFKLYKASEMEDSYIQSNTYVVQDYKNSCLFNAPDKMKSIFKFASNIMKYKQNVELDGITKQIKNAIESNPDIFDEVIPLIASQFLVYSEDFQIDIMQLIRDGINYYKLFA
jgi:hypothetical protein